VSAPEIAEEVTHDPTVVTLAFGAQRHAERIDGAVEDGGQRMQERGCRARFMRRASEGPNLLRHGARILLVDVLRGDLHIAQSSLDVSVTHQLHQRGQTDAAAYHVRGKGVSEAMRLASLMPVRWRW